MTKFIFLALSAATMSGAFCQAEDKPAKPGETRAVAKADRRIFGKEAIIAAIQGKSFASWGGRQLGQDSDHVLSFHEGGKITLNRFGVGHEVFKGVFEIDGNLGEISASFEGKPANWWPEMIVVRELGSSALRRADGKTHYYVPQDHGKQGEPDGKGFWPFRQRKATP